MFLVRESEIFLRVFYFCYIISEEFFGINIVCLKVIIFWMIFGIIVFSLIK